MPDRKNTAQALSASPKAERPTLDADTLRRLMDEGQARRRSFERRTAGMRVMTSDDLKTRSR